MGLRKLEFHDKITLSFSSSMNKKNEKFSSKSTESRKTMSWLHSKFRVWFPETLWLTNLESHIWKLVGLVAPCCSSTFLQVGRKPCDPGRLPALLWCQPRCSGRGCHIYSDICPTRSSLKPHSHPHWAVTQAWGGAWPWWCVGWWPLGAIPACVPGC